MKNTRSDEQQISRGEAVNRIFDLILCGTFDEIQDLELIVHMTVIVLFRSKSGHGRCGYGTVRHQPGKDRKCESETANDQGNLFCELYGTAGQRIV